MRTGAIIPAYNEATRITPALTVLAACPSLDEIIVVDDGSEDNLEEVVARFPRVKYVQSDTNRGKGHAMERGSKETTADILLFCDADVVGLSEEMIRCVVEPVVNGECDMFIGIFQTPLRGFFDTLFKPTGYPSGMNSGLRALRRSVWEALPDFYKHSYRVESGLNHLVSWKFVGTQYAQLPYTHVIKEKKYGLTRGSHLRWQMHFDLTITLVRIHFYERFFGFGKGVRRARRLAER